MLPFLTESNLLTSENYLTRFEGLVKDDNLSAAPKSKYTTLNWARTQRLHKTILIDPELKKAAERIEHNYTWLLLTEPWCGDSAQILPVITEIAKLNATKIKLNILLRDQNAELMNKFLTDGAKAIPKLIIIDETEIKLVKVWGPRPAPAQELLRQWKNNAGGKSWAEFENDLHSWYAKDKTKTTQSEFLKLLNQLS